MGHEPHFQNRDRYRAPIDACHGITVLNTQIIEPGRLAIGIQNTGGKTFGLCRERSHVWIGTGRTHCQRPGLLMRRFAVRMDPHKNLSPLVPGHKRTLTVADGGLVIRSRHDHRVSSFFKNIPKHQRDIQVQRIFRDARIRTLRAGSSPDFHFGRPGPVWFLRTHIDFIALMPRIQTNHMAVCNRRSVVCFSCIVVRVGYTAAYVRYAAALSGRARYAAACFIPAVSARFSRAACTRYAAS